MNLSVSTHQEILNQLQPLRDALDSRLIVNIQPSSDARCLGHEAFLVELDICTKDLVDAVQYLGESLLLGIDSVMYDAAKRVCQSGMELAEFQKRFVVQEQNYAVEQALWHMVESLQGQVFQWLVQYQEVVDNPEKFQDGDVSLMLELNFEKESMVLQELLGKDEKFGISSLVAGVGLGFFLGGD